MRWVLASNNAKKLGELRALFEPLGLQLIPQGELGIPEAEEPHVTFVENALAKARHAAQHSGLPAVASPLRRAKEQGRQPLARWRELLRPHRSSLMIWRRLSCERSAAMRHAPREML